MDIYQLDYLFHEPEESKGNMYLAEIPALQGAMARGETPEETLKACWRLYRPSFKSAKKKGRRCPRK